MNSYKNLYSHFLKEHDGKTHFASHSHYFWPDIAFKGYENYWKLSARESDQKWETIFSKHIPNVQNLIASEINFSRPSDISFAPNTQELYARVLSCFPKDKKLKILTTKSEFHSFTRQTKRLEEDGHEIIWLDNEEDSFQEKLIEHAPHTDLIYLSHVFYNSGYILPIDTVKQIIQVKNKNTLFLLDGYHSFHAINVNLKEFEDNLFYLAGCYKYAQAGEGLCFMTLPKNCQLRPQNTGWFASFSELENPSDKVSYESNGQRFASSTLDFSTLFKYEVIWNYFKEIGLSSKEIKKRSLELKSYFIKNLPPHLRVLVLNDWPTAQFATLDFPTTTQAINFHKQLEESSILTDRRNNRVRFSFSLYTDKADINSLNALPLFSKF